MAAVAKELLKEGRDCSRKEGIAQGREGLLKEGRDCSRKGRIAQEREGLLKEGRDCSKKGGIAQVWLTIICISEELIKNDSE